MTHLWNTSIEDASTRIKAREISVAELIAATLERLEETEGTLRAWASVDTDGARAAAVTADREIASGRWRGRMHGIPVGLKDVINTGGWRTEAGSRVLAGNVPSRDAAVVARLRDAGAIILGKTVTHEFALGQNDVPTMNPWDYDRYPGGSSVGSGVAVSVGSAHAALGTDTGGSVRNPAAVNGIVGLKPTPGLVSKRGVIPVSSSLDEVGPMTRTVADCALVLEAMVEPERGVGDEPASKGYHQALTGALGAVRIGVDRSAWLRYGADQGSTAAVELALDELVALGAELVEVSIPTIDLAVPTALALSLCESFAWHSELLRERALKYEPGTRIMLALGALVAGSDYVTARCVRQMIASAVREAFDDDRLDVMASPTLPWPAPLLADLRTDFTRSGGGASDLAGALRLLSWANVCGVPAVSVPCGASAEGLPFGLQLAGRPFAEARLLRVARAYEEATAWHHRRPDVPVPDAVGS